jgi:hypothetical protein
MLRAGLSQPLHEIRKPIPSVGMQFNPLFFGRGLSLGLSVHSGILAGTAESPNPRRGWLPKASRSRAGGKTAPLLS